MGFTNWTACQGISLKYLSCYAYCFLFFFFQKKKKAQRVEEAVNLFKTSIPASTAPSEKERVLREIHKAAGVVLFSNLKFSAAVQPLKVRKKVGFFFVLFFQCFFNRIVMLTCWNWSHYFPDTCPRLLITSLVIRSDRLKV